MNRYVKLPLIFAVPLAAYCFLLSDEPLRLGAWAFVFGALFGLLLVYINDIRVRNVVQEVTEESFSVHQKRTILLRCSYQTTFDLCLESLTMLKIAKVKKEDKKTEFSKPGRSIFSTILRL